MTHQNIRIIDNICSRVSFKLTQNIKIINAINFIHTTKIIKELLKLIIHTINFF